MLQTDRNPTGTWTIFSHLSKEIKSHSDSCSVMHGGEIKWRLVSSSSGGGDAAGADVSAADNRKYGFIYLEEDDGN